MELDGSPLSNGKLWDLKDVILPLIWQEASKNSLGFISKWVCIGLQLTYCNLAKLL